MSISTAPLPPPSKKRGLGCLGCGCLVLAVLVLLFVGLVAGAFYFGYQKVVSVTSTVPGEVPLFQGGDDIYQGAHQKIVAFGHAVDHHQATTIQLSGDEINSLIARDPDLAREKIRLFVTLTNDEARVQGSVPTAAFVSGFFSGHYLNFDTTFSMSFDSDTKSVGLNLHHFQIGEQPTPQNVLPAMQAEFTPMLNTQLQNYPETKAFLQQAKSIEIKDGELVIETQ